MFHFFSHPPHLVARPHMNLPENHEKSWELEAGLTAAQKLVQTHLVAKIAVAVALSKPELDNAALEKVEFIKRLFHEGEIDFIGYMSKMQNLFPYSLKQLSDELRDQWEGQLAVCQQIIAEQAQKNMQAG